VALTAVPDLVGLELSEADATLQARGFVIAKQTLGLSGTGGLVVSQRPAASTLAPLQSTVLVTLAVAPGSSGSPGSGSGSSGSGSGNPGSGSGSSGSGSGSSGSGSGSSGSGSAPAASTALAFHIAGARTVSCGQASQIALQIQLDRMANVAVRFLTAAGLPLSSMKLAPVHAGSRTLSLHLPFVLSRGKSYRMIVTASIGGQVVRDEIKLTIVRTDVRTTASASMCG